MFKTLRIICCIIAALIVAASVFIFVYANMVWGFVSILVAAVFFGLMIFFKSKQEAEELKKNPPPPVGDFITGKVPTDNNDENQY